MKTRAKDLKVGQVVRLECGDAGNWGNFEIDKVTVLEDSVDVLCHHGVIHMEFSWRPDEMKEVLE